MTQQLPDDFYALNRFRDKLTEATAVAETLGLVIDVPATLRGMIDKLRDARFFITESAQTDRFSRCLTVRIGNASMDIFLNPGRLPTIHLLVTHV